MVSELPKELEDTKKAIELEAILQAKVKLGNGSLNSIIDQMEGLFSKGGYKDEYTNFTNQFSNFSLEDKVVF